MSFFNFGKKKKSTEQSAPVANNVVNYVNNGVSQVKDDIVLKLLTLFERASHYVKEGDWYANDRDELYALKDKFLTDMFNKRPNGVEIEMLYVPYYKYSASTKDKAGAMMRADGNNQPFEFYLAQIQPSAEDYEISEKATIEMNFKYEDRTWCFHIPVHLTSSWGVNVNTLKRKVWMNGRDFHSQQFQLIKAEAEALLSKL